jgi:hypothetical protein
MKLRARKNENAWRVKSKVTFIVIGNLSWGVLNLNYVQYRGKYHELWRNLKKNT